MRQGRVAPGACECVGSLRTALRAAGSAARKVAAGAFECGSCLRRALRASGSRQVEIGGSSCGLGHVSWCGSSKIRGNLCSAALHPAAQQPTVAFARRRRLILAWADLQLWPAAKSERCVLTHSLTRQRSAQGKKQWAMPGQRQTGACVLTHSLTHPSRWPMAPGRRRRRSSGPCAPCRRQSPAARRTGPGSTRGPGLGSVVRV